MAFPGTLNINYYKGDTYEFRIYPKTSLGASFDLTGFGQIVNGRQTAKFIISTSRGSTGVADQIECLAEITSGLSGNYVTCTIRPDDSLTMNAATQYVYDVEITKNESPHPKIYTLLTGSVTVTDHIAGAIV
jgi:hypothetical protein